MKLISRGSCYCSLILMVLSIGSAWAEDRPDERGNALALGDSVVFGFITQAGHAYVNARNFIGYPDYVAAALNLNGANAGCPGEATTGFLSTTGADNGCRPFRAAAPLHVAYTTTQLDYATAFVKQHPDTRLVTLGIGANDLFLLQKACASSPDPAQCIQAGLPGTLASVATNVGTILAALRASGYGGVIVIVNYYSLDYSDPAGTEITVLLNQAVSAPARAFGAVVADVFGAFQAVASNPLVAGKTCNAGLLNVDPQNQNLCDVHPSQSGQQLIAQSVLRAYRAAAD